MAEAIIVRRGGNVSRLPEITYTGNYAVIDDGDGNWRIKCYTSGTLVFTKKSYQVDIFAVGGGGSGASGDDSTLGGGAGGSGYTKTLKGYNVQQGSSYALVIGDGGASVTGSSTNGKAGNPTSFATDVVVADGGSYGVASWGTGGDGGSGGAARNGTTGGTDGGNGTGGNSGSTVVGKGYGTTTREFWESTGGLYASGGNAYQYKSLSANGLPNTGNGGDGGAKNKASGAGGSGIVVIRNAR